MGVNLAIRSLPNPCHKLEINYDRNVDKLEIIKYLQPIQSSTLQVKLLSKLD